MKFLKLIRYQNLLLLAFMQLIFRYVFFQSQDIPLALADWQYGLFVLSTVLIAAGGYVINNIFDQHTDTINKPNTVVIGKSISETQGYNIYIALTATGVSIGFYLSNVIAKPGFATIFILIAATLYLYATSLKQMMLIGNIMVALLLSFSVVIIGIFDLFPTIHEGNQQQMANLFSILLDYTIFAFMINLLREIVKDIEDVDGDYNMGMNTLPIAIGKSRATKIVFVLSFIPLLLILHYIYNYLFGLLFVTLYLLFFVVAPLLYFTIKIGAATSKKEFHNLSLLLKWILLFGILSIVVISINMNYNA
ncbi:MAG TPA: geranylgeranylglycerol-phosphate geranylgeranyltransferase [Flavobacterium sp.]|uniref:geranylgeranylglycerol-phosphate geranylgeranyltransferase n=1 Tax=Flavobacterium sp. TaxID=239 RepID=UPI001B702184|nr:geranylgeranylglycerol-phosphate geranylgeranyltransferase [Flavobacterium sp.]MBP6146905.1 geranylgeranylglycerol-phosphate geranylgeranyltransferase [Flavobacterium sp.]MBP7182559.1 geranylgeranylglycerol-phosphate geranylgeranyltransferase [Flavobacterium sp.]MBP7318754.1 geranylgeranylglycerol-phosphate geranylgeranyltransferase [Flavobacterium sp.]MBP8887521.1 geranylgeranylglycerol-phosphate geranylgeranyltransferase [Flavobacterium sp.]HRL71344.1 geranylgeranylglycerol-phosphate gera